MSNTSEAVYDIMLMRLSSGEEIITKAKRIDSMYEVVVPIGIRTFPDKDGGVGASFTPFMASADKKISYIMGNHVQAIAAPDEGMMNSYLEAIGEKPAILTPNKDIILAK